MSRVRNAPKPDEIPSGLCECGCGQKTEIATYGNRRCRYFIGYPKPFVKGHHAKHSHLNNRGPSHPAWRGGIAKNAGYVLIYKPEHPGCNQDGYVLEHRLVMEQHLGRFLDKNEHVHHINQIRNDNRFENLQLVDPSEHQKIHGLGDYQRNLTFEQRSAAGKKGSAAKWKGHQKRKDVI